MRTNNGKRIGPVPIAVAAVFALAALLSAGLLLVPNGAPTAEAQDGTALPSTAPLLPDVKGCTVDDAAADTGLIHGAQCTTSEDTLDVVFENASTDEDGQQVLVYVTGGSEISNVQAMADGNVALGKKGLNEELFTIPAATAATTFSPQKDGKHTLTVNRSMKDGKGQVYLFVHRTAPAGIPIVKNATEWPASAPAELIVRVQFLGTPAIGKDHPTNDRNKVVDDYSECVPADDTDTLDMYEDEDISLRDGVTGECTTGLGTAGTAAGAASDIVSLVDTDESRSKLLTDTAGTGDGENDVARVNKMVIDGGSANHTISGDQDSATVYAVIKDEDNNALIDAQMTFTVTSEPATIATATLTKEAEAVENGDDVITGDTAVTGIALGDAIASFEIDTLPEAGPFKVTVVVTAKDLKDPVGTIVVQRAGKLDMVAANACESLGDKTDAMTMDGCMKGYDAKNRYGEGDTVTIHAAATDALGIPVTANMTLKPVTSDANYGDATEAFNLEGSKASITSSGVAFTGVPGMMGEGVAMIDVKDDAPGGHYMFIAEAKTGSSDDEIVKTAQVMIDVSGPPDSYMVDPMGTHYTTRSRVNFTVSARDENGLIPNFTMDNEETPKDESNNKVKIDAVYGTLRGVSEVGRDRYLTLDTDAGMGKFTYTLPRDAKADEKFDIFIGEGDMQETVTVVFGEAPPNMTFPGKPTMVEAEADGHDTINVSWAAPESDGHSPITGYIIERRYDGDMMGDIPSDGYSGTDGANRSFAFSDHMEWWETLNCKGMLAAADSSASDMAQEGESAEDTADRAKYCGHFLNTMPSNATMGELSDEAKAAVEALFDKRYVITGDTMTTYSDTDLMADTEYTYRVSAVNAIGRSMWSDDAMETTAANQAPMAGAALAAVMIDEGETATRKSTITDPEGDTLTWTVASSADTIATASVNTDTGEVTITGVSAGTATITVTATDADGSGMPVSQEIAVEVIGVLGEASGLTATANTDGSITLRWTAGNHATHHFVYGTDGTGVDVWAFSDGMSEHTVSSTRRGDALTSGAQYRFWVLSGRFHEQADGTWPGTWAMKGGVFAWAGPATATAN